MRIRKNAKLSPLLFSQGGFNGASSVPVEAFQTHVCQLNQSPWDVIPFASDSFQFEGEDSFTGNGSTGDSIGAVESVASMMDADDKSLPKIEDMAVDDNKNNLRQKQTDEDHDGRELEGKISWCQKSDGKGWHCKNEVIEGQSFCERHLTYSNGSSKYKKAAAAAAALARRAARARATKKASSSSSNPYEFYYYSGFGPLWGKRRSNRNGIETENAKNNETKEVENSTITEANNENENVAMDAVDEVVAATTSSSSQIDNEEFDYVEDDDEEDDDEEEANIGDDNGKKRMRKPVKARSLKSLM